jgi:hypothetical protein
MHDNWLLGAFEHDFCDSDVLAPMFLFKHNGFPLDNDAEEPLIQRLPLNWMRFNITPAQ